MRKILDWLTVKIEYFTKVLFYKYYIIDNLKSKIHCLNNTTINNCTISKRREYKKFCQEPTYKIMALQVLVCNNNSLVCNNNSSACNDTVEQRNSLRYKRF